MATQEFHFRIFLLILSRFWDWSLEAGNGACGENQGVSGGLQTDGDGAGDGNIAAGCSDDAGCRLASRSRSGKGE